MNSFWRDFPDVSRDLARVKELFEKALDQAPQNFKRDLSPLLQNGGKGLRPALVILAARSGDFKDTIFALAAAVELLHTATLIHDDIVDRAELRRGTPSFASRVGSAKAVLYGDLLLASCFHTITQNVSKDNALHLAKVVTFMAGAEIIQNDDLFRPQTSLRHALKKIMGKTASLLSLCLYVGASESGQTKEVCQRYRRLGYCLGMAFQIIDDILDFTSTEKVLGKPVLWDLAHGVYTLPTVFALRAESEGQTSNTLSQTLLQAGTDLTLLPQAAQLIAHLQGLQKARDLAAAYTARARQELSALPQDSWRKTLDQLLSKLLNRTY